MHAPFRRFVHILRTFFLIHLSQTVQNVHSQSTTTVPSDIGSLTPPFVLLDQILTTSFREHARSNLDVLDIASFEWTKAKQDVVSPFLVCVTGGRQGVVFMMNQWTVADSEPLWTSSQLTCFLAYGTPSNISKLSPRTLPQLQYLMPISGLYQLERNLTTFVGSGDFVKDPFECTSGLTFLTSPHFNDDEVQMTTLTNKIFQDLNDPPTLHAMLRDRFYWMVTKQVNTLYSDVWVKGIQNVLEGRVSCNFRNIQFRKEFRTVNVRSLCHVGTTPSACTDCILTMLAYLSLSPEISHIENVHKLEPFNVNAARIIQSGNSSTVGYRYWNAGVNGSNQLVQVFDSGLDVNNCYFADSSGVPPPISSVSNCTLPQSYNMSQRKVIGYTVTTSAVPPRDLDGHGTHVAGTVCGYITNSQPWVNNYAGLAPLAKVFVLGANLDDGRLSIPLSNFSSYFNCVYPRGVRLTTGSLGFVNADTYTSQALSIDEYLYRNDDYSYTGSAGNDGEFGTKSNSVKAWNNFKNGISVGASQCTFFGVPGFTAPSNVPNMTRIAYFSSIGPAPQGRIKPDVVAPGQLVISAQAGTACGTIDSEGTSMATPAVAGSVLLIRQYLQDGFYPTGTPIPNNAIPNPSNALIKAILITSARSVLDYQNAFPNTPATGTPVPPSPNIYAGFGLIQLQRVLRLNNEAYPILYIKDRVPVATNQVYTYKFSIPSITTVMAPFEVSLVWTDPPGTVASGGAVLNNIDLTATLDSDTRNRVMYPNRLNGPDTVNNVEKISIAKPVLGDVITVKVTGTNIAVTATQNFALAAAGVYVPAAWYCQDPRASRPNTLYTTANCRIPCQTHKKNPICCPADAGDVCTPAQADDSHCTGLRKPATC